MSQSKTQSQALHNIAEAADLIRMIEDLTNPTNLENLSSSSWSGMRITLRQVRESIMSSHGVLANDLISRSKATTGAQAQQATATQSSSSVAPAAAAKTSSNPAYSRQDLKSSLERYIE
jgi:hypothetical protein